MNRFTSFVAVVVYWVTTPASLDNETGAFGVSAFQTRTSFAQTRMVKHNNNNDNNNNNNDKKLSSSSVPLSTTTSTEEDQRNDYAAIAADIMEVRSLAERIAMAQRRQRLPPAPSQLANKVTPPWRRTTVDSVPSSSSSSSTSVPLTVEAAQVVAPTTTTTTTTSSSSSSNLASPAQAFESLVQKGEASASASSMKTLVSAALGGGYVGLGATLSLAVAGNSPNLDPGIQKFVFAALFPVNLLLAIQCGGQLYTGNTASMMAAVCEERATWSDLRRSWMLSWVGNFAGCLAVAILAKYSGVLEGGAGVMAAKVLAAKTSADLGQIIVKAMFCNWLVCLAVYLSLQAKDMGGKYLSIWLPVSTFVSIGFEHSVANMFLLPAGLMSASHSPDITIQTALFHNLLPVTVGNAISGSFLVGATLSYLYGKLGEEQEQENDNDNDQEKSEKNTWVVDMMEDEPKEQEKNNNSRDVNNKDALFFGTKEDYNDVVNNNGYDEKSMPDLGTTATNKASSAIVESGPMGIINMADWRRNADSLVYAPNYVDTMGVEKMSPVSDNRNQMAYDERREMPGVVNDLKGYVGSTDLMEQRDHESQKDVLGNNNDVDESLADSQDTNTQYKGGLVGENEVPKTLLLERTADIDESLSGLPQSIAARLTGLQNMNSEPSGPPSPLYGPDGSFVASPSSSMGVENNSKSNQ